MASYLVSVPITATATITVNADNKAEAKQMALDEGVPCLCYHCGNLFDIDEINEDLESIYFTAAKL